MEHELQFKHVLRAVLHDVVGPLGLEYRPPYTPARRPRVNQYEVAQALPECATTLHTTIIS